MCILTIPYVADIRPFIDESQPLARMAFPKDVQAFGWRHRPGEDITNAMNVAWMYPRLRKIYVPAKAISPEALKELRALLDEWTCGHAKIEVAGENE